MTLEKGKGYQEKAGEYFKNHPHEEASADQDEEEVIHSPGELPPFWQPSIKGEQKIGRLKSIRKTKFSEALHLMTEQGMVSIPLGDALVDVNWERYIGRILTITFDGFVETKSGNKLRDFLVTVRWGKTPF